MRVLWQLIGSPALCSTFNHGFLYFREGKEVRRFTVSILTLKKLLVQVGLFLFAMMLITDNSLQTVLFHCMRCVLSGIFITLHCVPYEISAFFLYRQRGKASIIQNIFGYNGGLRTAHAQRVIHCRQNRLFAKQRGGYLKLSALSHTMQM